MVAYTIAVLDKLGALTAHRRWAEIEKLLKFFPSERQLANLEQAKLIETDDKFLKFRVTEAGLNYCKTQSQYKGNDEYLAIREAVNTGKLANRTKHLIRQTPFTPVEL